MNMKGEKDKNMRNKGITLIALVITIIVLLILVGVTIATLTGDNGILTRANEAKEETEQAEKDEEADLKDIDNLVGSYIGNSSTITPNDYGKLVNYEKEYVRTTGTTSSDWEILYADNTNIYLISKYQVKDPTGSLTLNAGINTNYTTGSLLLNNKTQYPAARKWFLGWLNSSYANEPGSVYNNMQATLYMLDSKNVWNNLYQTEYADYAIGGPTLEMLVASYNDIKGTNLIVEPIDASGYLTTLDEGLNNGTVWNRGEMYWIACPRNGDGNGMIFMYSSEEKLSTNNYTAWCGFRPVVCLNSEVILESNADGTGYTIKN